MIKLYKLTVIGSGAAGLAIAADCALKGMKVNVFELEKFSNSIKPLLQYGGIEVTSDSKTTSGKTGFAKLNKVSTNPNEVIGDADVIMLSVPAMYHEYIFESISKFLNAGQIVLFNTGYWACLRIYKKYKTIVDSKNIKIAESLIMPYLSQREEPNKINIYNFKLNIPVTAFPGENSNNVFKVLKNYYTQFDEVPNVLYTNLVFCGNPCGHVQFSIPILGYMFDRYKGLKFYGETTLMGDRLCEAFDEERRSISKKLGINMVESSIEMEEREYGYKGKTLSEAYRKSPHAERYSSREAMERVLNEDICYSFIPLIQLGKLLGVPTPATESMVKVVSIMLNEDYCKRGITLEDLGLTNLTKEEILSYINKGFIEI